MLEGSEEVVYPDASPTSRAKPLALLLLPPSLSLAGPFFHLFFFLGLPVLAPGAGVLMLR